MRLTIIFLFQNKLLVSCPLCQRRSSLVFSCCLWQQFFVLSLSLSLSLSFFFPLLQVGTKILAAPSLSLLFFSSVTSWNKNISCSIFHWFLISLLKVTFLGNKFFLKSVAVPDFPAFYINWYFSILLILLSFLGVCSRPFGMSYFNLWVHFFMFFFQNFSVPEDLSAYDGLELRLKGDGRKYKFIIRTSSDWDTVGYTASFDTVAGQWQSVSDI